MRLQFPNAQKCDTCLTMADEALSVDDNFRFGDNIRQWWSALKPRLDFFHLKKTLCVWTGHDIGSC